MNHQVFDKILLNPFLFTFLPFDCVPEVQFDFMDSLYREMNERD